MVAYSSSWFVARVSSRGDLQDDFPFGKGGIRWRLPSQQIDIQCSAPDLLAVDDQAGLAVLVHGDIYDPQGGPQALLESYRSQGKASLESLNGSFAGLIVDKPLDTVFVATDRFSSRKVFSSQEADGWWLSTSLYRHPTSHRALSAAGIGSTLSSGVAHADLTPFEGVRKLGPATLGTFTAGRLEVDRYWGFSESPLVETRPAAELRQQLVDTFRTGVGRRLKSSGQVFVSLSGGYDSRTVAGLLRQLVDSPDRIHALTYHHASAAGDTDVGAAHAVAKHLGISHETVEAYNGDLLGVIGANAEFGQGVANFCQEVDAWLQIGPAMSLSNDNTLFVADIPGMAVAPKGGTPESVLASVDVYPISTVEYFLAGLDVEAAEALRRGWGAHYAELLATAASHSDPRDGHDHIYLDQRLTNTLMMWRERFQAPHVRVANPFLDNETVDLWGSLPVDLREQKTFFRQAIAEAMPALLALPVSPGGWNAPNWARELRANTNAIRDLLNTPSRLDEIISPTAIEGLLDRGLSTASSGRDNVTAFLRTMVRHSAPLRRIVRATKVHIQPAATKARPWDRLVLDLLSLRGFLSRAGR